MIGNDWDTHLQNEYTMPYFKQLIERIKREYEQHTIYPPRSKVFRALKETPFQNVKVVILGQDPYYNPNQANGLAFSVEKGQAIPKSLQNIFKEQRNDLNIKQPNHGDLTEWAKQGVLLLNTVLTVRHGQPNSHAQMGWQLFTDTIIKSLNYHPERMIYLLWGRQAQLKKKLIDQTRHTILEAPHPSPLSAFRGFFGCRHFSKTNQILQRDGRVPINWQLSN